MTTSLTQGEHAQPEALHDFEVRKLAAIGAVSTSSGLVERRPIEYRRELEDQFVRGFRAAEKRLAAQVAALTAAQPVAPPHALAQLRHLYHNMIDGAVRDAGEAKTIAAGVLGPVIVALETAVTTAQPVAQQGGAYAELPARRRSFFCTKCGGRECEPNTLGQAHPVCKCGYMGFAEDLDYTADQMRDFADRTHALRASHGQAPAGAAGIPGNFITHRAAWRNALEVAKTHASCDDVSYWEHELRAFDRSFDRLWTLIQQPTPTAQPAPAATPQADSQPAPVQDMAVMQLAESVGLIGPASRTHDLHAAVQRFHDLICVNATIKAAVMAADAIRGAATPARDYPPLPMQFACSGVFPVYSADQMRAYVDADRAARAPADSVTAPAGVTVAVGSQEFDLADTGARFTTADMATACGQAFREGLAAAPTPPAQAADSVLEDAAFEAVRKKLCALPRYSFVLDDDGLVRRVQNRVGNWIEFDDAHALFDPVAVDAARKQGANHD